MKLIILSFCVLPGIPFLSFSQVSNNCLGVFSVVPWSNKPAAQTLQDTSVDGIVSRYYWTDLETIPGSYHWNSLDSVFNYAQQYNKKIHLMIAPGFYSPAWVIAASQTDTFYVPQGPYLGTKRLLPLPWDSIYLNYWFHFIDTVAARYSNRSEFKYISVTGPNSHNGEMELPNDSVSQVKWRAIAGTPAALKDLLEQAWNKTIYHFGQVIPIGKYFTVALVTNSLPLGGTTLEAGFKTDIVSYGITNFPNRFGIQTNGLDGRLYCPTSASALPHWSYIQDNSSSTLTGFQTNSPENLYICLSHPSDSILLHTVNNAITFKSHFIEIYQSDISNDTLQAVIMYAHRSLSSCIITSTNDYPSAAFSVRVYPNPTADELIIQTTITLHNAELTIFNSAGQTVRSISKINGTQIIIDNKKLSSGFYFILLKNGNKQVTKKIFVDR